MIAKDGLKRHCLLDFPRVKAFNQSESSMRSDPIYLRLPAGGLPSHPEATIARMEKEVNGVVSGPA
eukprot:2759430-Amphidinium_carterae.1